MRVLYVASRTPQSESLELEREVTDLQRGLATQSSSPARFAFFPSLTVEELPIQLLNYQPDVLHISVHGEAAGLWFSTEEGKDVRIDADALFKFLPAGSMPKLVLLNACKSHLIANALSKQGIVAIGSTAPITNKAAISGAALLYNRLLSGYSIESAFNAIAALVRTLQSNTTMAIYGDRELRARPLFTAPTVVAKLPSGAPWLVKGNVRAQVGMIGCPPSTTQLCVFTDDPTFARDDAENETSMSEIIREPQRGGELWTKSEWGGEGDFRVGACGITGGGETFSGSSMLSDALEAYARAVDAPEKYRAELTQAVEILRTRSGVGLKDWVPPPAMNASSLRKKR